LIIIAIPAYNEEANIGSLLERIASIESDFKKYHVLIIDDGSTDNTVNVIKSFQDKMPVSVVSHETNRGVGQVFRTAFAAALKMAGSKDIIVTMEADNTSDLSILKKMIHQVEQGNDVVLASCYSEGGGVEGSNLFRIVLSAMANSLLEFCYPIGVKTYSSFYRAYWAESLRAAYTTYEGRLIEEAGFVCMVEILVKLHRLSMCITEVPMLLKTNERRGSSKMKVLRTIWGYLRFITRDLLLRGRPVLSDSIARQPRPEQGIVGG
jgi:dolichol-phosphate mannosyltransferase